jgi:ABC-type phosphate/phosphonate transport system substrate-binding protein
MRPSHVLAVALLTLAGWVTPSAATDPSWPKELTFALLSTENASDITRRWGPILAQLEKDLGVKVKAVTATDYRGTIEALKFKKRSSGTSARSPTSRPRPTTTPTSSRSRSYSSPTARSATARA